jgi:hypothetical protein
MGEGVVRRQMIFVLGIEITDNADGFWLPRHDDILPPETRLRNPA